MVRARAPQVVRQLLQRGVDAATPHPDGRSALHDAVGGGRLSSAGPGWGRLFTGRRRQQLRTCESTESGSQRQDRPSRFNRSYFVMRRGGESTASALEIVSQVAQGLENRRLAKSVENYLRVSKSLLYAPYSAP